MPDPLDQHGRTVFSTIRLRVGQTRGNTSPCTGTDTVYKLVMVDQRN